MRDSRVPESAAAPRRVPPALGFFLDDGHGHADQPVDLLGAGFGEKPFTPRAFALTERIEQAAQEREQGDALQLHPLQLLARLVRALRQPLVAVGVAQALGGERGDDLHEAHVGVREGGAVAVGPQENRADRDRPPRDRDDGDRLHATIDQLALHVPQGRIVRRIGNEDRLAALHRALELRIALEVDDVVANRGVLVRCHEADLPAAFFAEENGAAVEAERLAQLAGD